MSIAKDIREHVREELTRPYDFESALAALRRLDEIALKAAPFWIMNDEIELVRRYVYDRATPDEIREAARKWK